MTWREGYSFNSFVSSVSSGPSWSAIRRGVYYTSRITGLQRP
jgi:hypothetical protein